jgi:hypothetical protein
MMSREDSSCWYAELNEYGFPIYVSQLYEIE